MQLYRASVETEWTLAIYCTMSSACLYAEVLRSMGKLEDLRHMTLAARKLLHIAVSIILIRMDASLVKDGICAKQRDRFTQHSDIRPSFSLRWPTVYPAAIVAAANAKVGIAIRHAPLPTEGHATYHLGRNGQVHAALQALSLVWR